MSQQAAEALAEDAVSSGFATREQIDTCLNLWRTETAGGKAVDFGPFMVSLGYLTSEQFQQIEQARRRKAQSRIPGFEIIGKLGEGSMGVVYKAIQTNMDREVALKVLKPDLAKDEQYRARFMREARSTALLNHPNVIRGIDVGESGGLCWFATEFIDGDSVDDIVARGGPMEERRTLEIARDVAGALDHAAENGLVHRDIKPENIMVTTDGKTKLADLGLAKNVQAESTDVNLTQVGVVWGTPNYLSPEQCRGGQDLDIRTDIYSLGVTLYFMLTGQLPFVGKTAAVVLMKHVKEEPLSPAEHRPELHSDTCAIVLKMMEKDVKDRYQSGAELAEAIERRLRGKSVKPAKRVRARNAARVTRREERDRAAESPPGRGRSADRGRREGGSRAIEERQTGARDGDVLIEPIPIPFIVTAITSLLIALLFYFFIYRPGTGAGTQKAPGSRSRRPAGKRTRAKPPVGPKSAVRPRLQPAKGSAARPGKPTQTPTPARRPVARPTSASARRPKAPWERRGVRVLLHVRLPKKRMPGGWALGRRVDRGPDGTKACIRSGTMADRRYFDVGLRSSKYDPPIRVKPSTRIAVRYHFQGTRYAKVQLNTPKGRPNFHYNFTTRLVVGKWTLLDVPLKDFRQEGKPPAREMRVTSFNFYGGRPASGGTVIHIKEIVLYDGQ